MLHLKRLKIMIYAMNYFAAFLTSMTQPCSVTTQICLVHLRHLIGPAKVGEASGGILKSALQYGQTIPKWINYT